MCFWLTHQGFGRKVLSKAPFVPDPPTVVSCTDTLSGLAVSQFFFLAVIFDPCLSRISTSTHFLRVLPWAGPAIISSPLSLVSCLYRAAFISDTWSIVLKHILTFQRTLMASHFRPKEVQTSPCAVSSLFLSCWTLSSRLTSTLSQYAPCAVRLTVWPMHLPLFSLLMPFCSALTNLIKIRCRSPFLHDDLNAHQCSLNLCSPF